MPYIFKKKETGAKTTVSMSAGRIAEPGIPLDVHGDVVEISNPEQHAMVVAASGRGKTRRILFPAVVLAARAGRSLVINDPKAEIYRATSNEVRRCGYEVRVLDLRNPLCGDRWSPLTLVQKYWDSGYHGHASELLSDIAGIITEKIHSDRDRYWKQAAIDVFLGFSLLVLEHGRRLTFATVHSFINEYYRETELRERFRLHIDHYADSYRRLCTVLHLDSEITLGCVVSEINSAISEFVDREDVRDLLVGADFDLTSFGKKKVAYYLVSKDESTALHSIVSLFVSQTYAELVHYADTREDNTLPTRVDFILDEFGNLFGCDWVCKLTAARSRGIRFILALQDLSQLSDKYGEHGAQALFSNCRTIVFQGGKDFRMMGMLSALSEVVDESGIPRTGMSVPELAGLAIGETVILDDSGHPRRGHLPDWTAWGISDRAAIATTKRVLEAVHIPSLEGIICETEGRNKRPFAEGSESETDAKAADPESPEGRTALGNNPDEKKSFLGGPKWMQLK